MRRLKESRAFLLGMAVTLSMTMLVNVASAVSGQVAFNQIGIRLFGESKVTAGESCKASNGQEIPPQSRTQMRLAERRTTSVRQISELLDAEVAWNSAVNSVDIATYNGTQTKPKVTGVLVMGDEEMSSPYPNKAEFGVTHGAFQEIDPSTVDTSGEPGSTYLKGTRITADTAGIPAMAYSFHPVAGKYVVFQVTNNGTKPQAVTVERVKTVGNSRTEPFTTVTLAPGQTVTRAFAISSDSTRLERTLEFGVDPVDRPDGQDITISLMQYK